MAENISLFNDQPDQQRVAQCARMAIVHDAIITMPMGYETLVGDMSNSLSGGEKQRVRWPHLDHLTGCSHHLFPDELDRRGTDFVCRMFGNMMLGAFRIGHPAAMNKYVFEPITPAHLIDNDSNIERLPPVDRGAILPFHVAVGLSNSAMWLKFVYHDADQQALGIACCVPLYELQALGPNDGADVRVVRASHLEAARAENRQWWRKLSSCQTRLPS
jgi:hypothetical protein